MSQSVSTPARSCLGTRIRSASVQFVPRKFLTPLKISSGVIDEITEAQVSVEVELDQGRVHAVGRGTIYLSDMWSWPDASIDHHDRDRILRRLCTHIASRLPNLYSDESLHPLELGLRLHAWTCHQLAIEHNPPSLARAMCSSPFDAAIHDAVGLAIGRCAFAFFDEPAHIPSADPFFPGSGAIHAIRQVLQSPRSELPAWWLIGQQADVHESVGQALQKGKYHCFKLKIGGQDNTLDVKRTVGLYQAARSRCNASPRLTVDSNEANPDAASVLDFLERLEKCDSQAFAALQYLEQPTGRDISRDAFDWIAVARRKPVLLDEGLIDLTTLEPALSQGWSGLALKTCKGQSMMLATAAWAHAHGMVLALQDLTNPGISLIQAALAAAYLPTINGVELNSPQYTPAANEDFLPRLAPLFEPIDGYHRLGNVSPAGLGSTL
jgi:L-alanine-DL-glutamate epimerase-like enolase superfamily enzyme